MSLEVKNLVKKYGDKTVVNNLTFSLPSPGVYALLGTNGAGKTTTLRIILGMLSHDAGEVLWKGKVLDAIKSNVGYLAEERGLYPKYSLMDQLIYFARLKGTDRASAEKRIKYWAQRLEAEEWLYPSKGVSKPGRKKPKENTADMLSKGNQQKIQLMAALISDPELLILDEPLSGLDPVNTDLFKGIIREIISEGKYLIMSSHQMTTIEEFCEEITILNRGETVLQGNLNDIKKSYGRVNMIVKCEGDIEPYIKEFDFQSIVRTPDGINMRVTGEDMAGAFLKRLIDEKVPVIKFELREPSLHEIFVEKAGDTGE